MICQLNLIGFPHISFLREALIFHDIQHGRQMIRKIKTNKNHLTWGGGGHSTEIALMLLTQLPWF